MRQNNSFFVEQGKLKDSRLLFLSRYDYEKVRRRLSADSLLYPVFLKRDFYEVALPRKNEQIHITPQNAEFLYRILTRYENRKVEYDNGKIYENGKELTSLSAHSKLLLGNRRQQSRHVRLPFFRSSSPLPPHR